MNGQDFVNHLLTEINKFRGNSEETISDDHVHDGFSEEIIKHWLNFAVYYEKASVMFISGWMKTTYEDDLLLNFSHQIEDECNHYRWLKRHLSKYMGPNNNNFQPPAEWKFLMEEFYPSLGHAVERLAAHNIASETGAIGFLEYGLNHFPKDLKTTVEKILKDEHYHVSFGCRLLAKYCESKDLQERAYTATLQAMEFMTKARNVFVTL
jgi:rubrerythrin